MDKKSKYVIYETTDYEKFKLLEANREVGRIIELEESIDNVGLLPIAAIVNENYEIIDGQHRYFTCKKNGLPFMYVLVPGLTAESCQWLNRGQKNWKAVNYLHLYARLGYEDYQQLESLLNHYKGIFSLEDILCFVFPSGVNGGISNKIIRDKELELSEQRVKIIDERLKKSISLGFIEIQKERKLHKRSYWSAISYVFKHKDVSIEQFAQKLFKFPLELQSYNKTADMLNVFDTINNKGKQHKIFMSSDFQQGKYRDE